MPSRGPSTPPPHASAIPMHAAPLLSQLSSSAGLDPGGCRPLLDAGRPAGGGAGAQASAEPCASVPSMHVVSSAGAGRSATGELPAARCTKVTEPAATAARSGASSTLPDTSWTGGQRHHASVAQCWRYRAHTSEEHWQSNKQQHCCLMQGFGRARGDQSSQGVADPCSANDETGQTCTSMFCPGECGPSRPPPQCARRSERAPPSRPPARRGAAGRPSRTACSRPG